MRIGSFAFVTLIALSVGVVTGGACSSSVQTETGSTGSGGSETTSSTSTATGTTTTTTGTTTSSTGTGTSVDAGDACTAACDHITMCSGFNACGMGFNLDCTNPQNQCEADCINAIPCNMVNTQTVPACITKCAPADAGPVDAGDPCMSACAHVQQCTGIDICSQLGMQFDCSNPQNACIATCLNNTPCGMLGFQTFQTCQAMCQAADGGPPPPMDAGSGAQACTTCSTQACMQPIGACATNMGCQQWLGCVQNCNNAANPVPSCYTACDAQFPGSKALYDGVYACACTNCKAECASTSDPCGAH
jgi:hypothetical protein